MPYTTEKAMIFQVVETWGNGSRDTALQAMWDLLDGIKKIADFDVLRSTTLNYAPYETVEKRQRHVEEDWWGHTPIGPAANVPRWSDTQPPYHERPMTGFWKHWYGDAEGVFRETMIRALAVSLGLPRETEAVTKQWRGKPRPQNLRGSGQHWPISILWKCPSPWYEGWIEFKAERKPWWRLGPPQGHVTVVLSTPSHGVKLYDTPLRPSSADSVALDPYQAYRKDPVEPAGPEGLWVVSQTLHTLMPNTTQTSAYPGEWGPPVLGKPVLSTGPVVCVAPAVPDGGAAPSGIPFTPA